MLMWFKLKTAQFLLSPPMAFLVATATRRRVRRYGCVLTLPKGLVPEATVASVFFGLHESAERRLVLAHLAKSRDSQPRTVVELGACVGFLGSLVNKADSGLVHYVALEPNPTLGMVLRNNLLANGAKDPVVVHAALAYDSATVHITLDPDRLVGSSLGPNRAAGTVEVNAVTLSSLISDNGIGSFDLMCDIEGLEWEILEREPESLKRCETFILEVHPSSGRSTEDFIRRVEDLGFRLLDRDGHAVAFRRGSDSAPHSK